jgi:hypothetical protein
MSETDKYAALQPGTFAVESGYSNDIHEIHGRTEKMVSVDSRWDSARTRRKAIDAFYPVSFETKAHAAEFVRRLQELKRRRDIAVRQAEQEYRDAVDKLLGEARNGKEDVQGPGDQAGR